MISVWKQGAHCFYKEIELTEKCLDAHTVYRVGEKKKHEMGKERHFGILLGI